MQPLNSNPQPLYLDSPIPPEQRVLVLKQTLTTMAMGNQTDQKQIKRLERKLGMPLDQILDALDDVGESAALLTQLLEHQQELQTQFNQSQLQQLHAVILKGGMSVIAVAVGVVALHLGNQQLARTALVAGAGIGLAEITVTVIHKRQGSQ